MVLEGGTFVAVRVPERVREHQTRRALAGQERCSHRGGGGRQSPAERCTLGLHLPTAKTTTTDMFLFSKVFRHLLIKKNS